MNKKDITLFITASISVLIPTNGRFGYGFILILAVLFFCVLNMLIREGLNKLNIIPYTDLFSFICLIMLVVFFKLILMLVLPLQSFVLSFSLYLAALSSIVLRLAFIQESSSLIYDFKQNIIKILLFCLFGLVFYFLRDYLGYGTLTFPSKTGLIIKELPTIHLFDTSFFWGSIPVGLFLLAIIVSLFYYIMSLIKPKEKKNFDDF